MGLLEMLAGVAWVYFAWVVPILVFINTVLLVRAMLNQDFDFQLREQTECTICLQSMRADRVDVNTLACRHMFHVWCIDEWLSGNTTRSRTCPICRAPIQVIAVLNQDFDFRASNNREIGSSSRETLATLTDLTTVLDDHELHARGRAGLEQIEFHPLLSEQTECTICLESMRADHVDVNTLACRHMFHIRCIDMWLNGNTTRSRTCPICTAPIQIVPL